jgi:pimeloyl-ACP methyl ester carboxylesterase
MRIHGSMLAARPRRALVALTAAGLTLAGASIAAPGALAQGTLGFVASACPQMPGPIPELKTARCGHLTVPENRTTDNGRTIRLSVAIIPAQAAQPKPDPIVWLAGGPGDDAITEIPMALAGDLNSDRDVIFLSQRGTYSATPSLTCPEVDRVGAEQLDLPYDSAAVGRLWRRATLECRRRWVSKGVDLSAYNTTESSADLEDLRKALGITQWNVYGISYGTDAALQYLHAFPDGIRSVAIDGIFPPQLAGGVAAWQSAGEGINAVFDACEADARCHARYGNIGATFRRLVRRYERHPKTFRVKVEGVKGRVAVKISGGMLVQWAVSPGTHLAGTVPAAFDALAHGDAAPIAVPWAQSRLNPAGVGILGVGLFNGVACSEWVPYESQADVLAAGRKAFPTFGASIWRNAPNLQFMREFCRLWDVPRAPAAVRDATSSRAPTLVVSAQYDGQTAPSFGALVAQTLANSTVTEIPNVAHVAFGSPSPKANACAWSMARSFFNVLNQVDTGCTKRVPPTKWVITPRR